MTSLDHTKLFWIDAGGALLTAFMHGFILTRFSEFIGIPDQILIYLAFIAMGFAIYSTSCAYFKPRNWRPLLRIIASANICFCIATICLMFIHKSEVTKLGIAYFLLEIFIVLVIAGIEFKKANEQ